MDKQAAITKSMDYLSVLPSEKVEEAFDFIEYLYTKRNQEVQTAELTKLVSSSDSFKFLENEEDLYTASDVKVLPL